MINPGEMSVLGPPATKESPKPLVEADADEAPTLFTAFKLPPLIEAFFHVCVVALNEVRDVRLGTAMPSK